MNEEPPKKEQEKKNNQEEQEMNRKRKNSNQEEQEMNRKRKNSNQENQVSKIDGEDNDFLALALSYGSRETNVTQPLPRTSPPMLPQPQPQQPLPLTSPPMLPQPQQPLPLTSPPMLPQPQQPFPLTSPPMLPQPQQQQEPQKMLLSISNPLSMQTLFSQSPPQFPLQLSDSHPLYNVPFASEASSSAPVVYPQGAPAVSSSAVPGTSPTSRSIRSRRNRTQAPREGKAETVPPPFPWATTHRATLHSINYLLSKQIFTITGDVQCKRCERQFKIAYDLKERFAEVGSFIAVNKSAMHDRAPPVWMNPVLPKCKFCDQENSVKPVISVKKKSINWLFLLLGQMLGCCTLEQLKYFCKHTKNHRTGAKDRVLYLTYLGLCKQLDPNGPFNR